MTVFSSSVFGKFGSVGCANSSPFGGDDFAEWGNDADRADDCSEHGFANFGSGAQQATHPLGGWTKRALDFTVALALLLATLPAILLIAALITLCGGGSPIFAHPRVGYRGRVFQCYKFRTMRRHADDALAMHLSENPAAAREWNENRKLKHDPRITPLGRFLRKASLDELPQLINILLGDMSCVGPRPVTIEELELYGKYLEDYRSSRPGLTGLWQVRGRSGTDFSTRVSFDHEYVRNWSFAADLAILARTPAAVLRTNEAY